ncbi:MAG: hypothetical protein IPG23_15555 [Burkholderiales bacterium]|nr:hypothetical protein [Burkholderiales bacterium]
MNAQLSVWWAQLMATDAPALPTALAMQIWLHLGWSVVLASVGAGVVSRYWPGTAGRLELRHWGAALVLALWAWVPGPYSPAYWLGLVFQAPSIVAVLLCDGFLRKRFLASRSAPAAVHEPNRFRLSLVLAGVLLGWALLLDTFALLPLQLYAWGFSPVTLALVLLVTLLPWLAGVSPRHSRWWVSPVALLVFVVVRLPSGNVWDAVLDPCLWLALHGYLLRAAWRHYTARSVR